MVSSVFGVVGMVGNIFKKSMVISLATHVGTLAYKATTVGSWIKPLPGKKLVALLSRVAIMFKVGGYNASVARGWDRSGKTLYALLQVALRRLKFI